MSVFELEKVALSDTNLIEASAGTGKTYTLAGLYLRLVLEEKLNVDQILVVTYTRAATQELRDRLRQKLADARDELREQPGADLKAINRLDLAVQSFDEAAIFTIHSFCQQVLRDFAFESGMPFETELVGDDRELLQQITDDFWRREVVQGDAELAAYLHHKKQSPETLLASVRSLVGKPYLAIQPVPEVDIDARKLVIESVFKQVRQCWQREAEEAITLLRSGDLKKNSYPPQKNEALITLLESLCAETDAPAKYDDLLDLLLPETLTSKGLKKGGDLPELALWPAIEAYKAAYTELDEALTLKLQKYRLDLLGTIREQLPVLKNQQKQMSYDDLLIDLQQALAGPQGEWLISRLREQYRAALIDEFQDTDPVQYDNFRRVFADSGLPVFYVGDPKQAIYSFRGADIFTYLRAKKSATHQHTLAKNWRSHQSLVEAINHIFDRRQDAFYYQNIPFEAVAAARDGEPALQVDDDHSEAFQLFYADSDHPLNVGEMDTLAVETTADEIARLLNLAGSHQARLVDDEKSINRPLNGGDIAILVPKHQKAVLMQQALRERGIHSVQQGRDNVFASEEAADLQVFIRALAQPAHPQRVATLLAGPLFKLQATAIHDLFADEPLLTGWMDYFHSLQQRWQQQGFMAVLRSVLNRADCLQRLLTEKGGERRLTNYLHLGELIQNESARQNHRIETVREWLAWQCDSSEQEDETAQLRLESDASLVKIMTIHASKGLEYPIVFCPFLWTSATRKSAPEIVEFHDPEADYQPSAATAGEWRQTALEYALYEDEAQAMRLLYVALTRARERCVVFWGAFKNLEQSSLYRLLHKPGSEQWHQDIQTLAAEHPHIGLREVQSIATISWQGEQVAEQLKAREFDGEIQTPWRIGSFSYLSHGQTSEKPDYDALSPLAESILSVTESHDRFGFARGRQAGIFLHKCLELLDFKQTDTSRIQSLVESLLPKYAIAPDWSEPVTQWLHEVLLTPLDSSGLRLTDIDRTQRLDEMAVYFPVNGLSVSGLREILHQTETGSIWQILADDLHFYRLDGFMKGFIDLVFEHEGRFYLADYKSNWLGRERAAYQVDALQQAMQGHAYQLQYLIYSLALHRYLQSRLPDYDPQQHFGGVYYLFIRGMQPAWESSGVFFDALDRNLLHAFDQLMAGE